MKYLLYLFGAAVLVLAFIGLFRLALRQPKRPITGKYLSRLAALALALLCLAFFWTYDGALTLTAQMSSDGEYATLYYFDRGDDAFEYSRVLNEAGEVRFELPKARHLRLVRFDPIEREGELTLSGMQIRFFGFQLESIPLEKLYEGMQTGQTVITLTPENIEFKTAKNDSICILSDAITETLNGYLRVYSILTLVVSAVFGVLAWFLFNMKRARAFFDGCVTFLQGWCEHKRIYPSAMIIAAIHFVFCFYIQHAIFPFELKLLNRILFYECLFFGFLIILWQVIFNLWTKVKNGNQAAKDFLKFSAINFCIMFVFLLLIWPGYISPDDYVMLWRSMHWEILAGYHFLAQGAIVLMQMLIPGAGGIELCYCLYISVVVGYVIREIYVRNGRTRWIYLLYIPLAFPAILLNNMQWEKSTFGTYLEILLLCKIICAILDERRMTPKDVFEWIILTAITFTLRTDGIYYIVVAPVVFLLIFKKKAGKRMLIVLCAGIILLCGVFQTIQNAGGFDAFYKLVNFSRLIYAPTVEAAADNDEVLSEFSGLFDVDAYVNADNRDVASGVFPVNELSATIDDATLSNFSKNVAKLIIRHPIAYFVQQLKTFLCSSGFGAFLDDKLTYNMVRDNYQGPDTRQWGETLCTNVNVYEIDDIPFNHPIQLDLRLHTILFCMGRSVDGFAEYSIRDLLFSNLIPSVVFLLACFFYLLKKKEYKLVGVSILFLLRLPLLFASAPYVAFQYYLRFFVVGNAIPFFFLVRYLSKKKEVHLAEE